MIKKESGQALIEMALLLPLLLLLLVGIFDLGRILYTQMHLHIATQETVRLGGLGASDSEMIDFAKNYVDIDASLLSVNITPLDEERSSGNYVTVTLQYPAQFFTPLVSKIIPESFILSANSTVRVE